MSSLVMVQTTVPPLGTTTAPALIEVGFAVAPVQDQVPSA